MQMRGFVIDGPFMVFGDGFFATADIVMSRVGIDGSISLRVRGLSDTFSWTHYRLMSPEQERDYKPMFPDEAYQGVPDRTITEDDVHRFLHNCNMLTLIRIVDKYDALIGPKK
jgi:hypothetical protein